MVYKDSDSWILFLQQMGGLYSLEPVESFDNSGLFNCYS